MSLFRGIRLIAILSVILGSSVCWAELDEHVIATPDGHCAIRYLSVHPKQQWTIETDVTNCVDGFVQGFATVQVYNPLHSLVETLHGFFLNGYWLDSGTLVGNLQDRSNPQDGIQSLTFYLGRDVDYPLSYLVQARSTHLENRPYGPFTVCPIVRILVVGADKTLFQQAEVQDHMAQQGVKYARVLCPDIEEVAIFATQQMNARASDIDFQMQINPDTMEMTIVPVSYDYQKSDISMPVELRSEKGEIVSTVQVLESQTSGHEPHLDIPVDVDLSTVAELQVLSRLSGQSVMGRVVVHIQSVDLDGTGHVDLPEAVLLKYYPNLKTGWAVIQGRIMNHTIGVSQVIYCQQEWCTDVA